jgi:hypothetical protein
LLPGQHQPVIPEIPPASALPPPPPPSVTNPGGATPNVPLAAPPGLPYGTGGSSSGGVAPTPPMQGVPPPSDPAPQAPANP